MVGWQVQDEGNETIAKDIPDVSGRIYIASLMCQPFPDSQANSMPGDKLSLIGWTVLRFLFHL